MAIPTMKQLLEAGVHFGHQTRRWNPKMKPFIFTARNDIHIIDLQQTVSRFKDAYNYVVNLTSNGESILFIGTKKQAQETVAEEAQRSGQYYVNFRWLGGMLTNFQTIQKRIRYMRDLEARKERGEFERLPKKEAQRLDEELARLQRVLGGIRDMRRLPAAVFVIDTRKEHTAVLEARRLEIPVIALADTNCDPDEMDFPIPANDDAIRAVRLLCQRIADAAVDGRRQAEARRKDETEEGEPQRRATEAPVALEEFERERPEAPESSAETPADLVGAAPDATLEAEEEPVGSGTGTGQ